MPVNMTAYINCNRQTCDVGGIRIDIDSQCCHSSAQTAGPNSKSVNFLKQFLFQFFFI